MSIETYEELTSRFELYSQIKEGMDDIATGNTRPFSEVIRWKSKAVDRALLSQVYGYRGSHHFCRDQLQVILRTDGIAVHGIGFFFAVIALRQVFYDLVTKFFKAVKPHRLYKTHDCRRADSTAFCRFFQRNLTALYLICQHIISNLFPTCAEMRRWLLFHNLWFRVSVCLCPLLKYDDLQILLSPLYKILLPVLQAYYL